MTKTMKIFLTMITAFAFVTGCSTNTDTDGEDTSDTSVETPTETVDEAPVADPMDALIGVDKVFYFDFDQALLKTEARTALLIHADVIKQIDGTIRLEGHADERGSREYNMALGERRANAVRDFLILQGVSSSAIETVSYGEEQPARVGSNDSSWAKNRRVEIKY